MNAWRQIAAITWMNVRGLKERLDLALVIVLGMAVVVGVVVAIMAISNGVSHSMDSRIRPGHVMVMNKNAQNEGMSSITREAYAKILDAPGWKKGSDGRPLVGPVTTTGIPITLNNGRERFISIRGSSGNLLEVRPDFQMVEGRMYHPGLRELIVGDIVRQAVKDLQLGNQLPLSDGPWTIVGVYKTDGTVSEWAMWGDADTLMPTYRRNTYNSLMGQLESDAQLPVIQAALAEDPNVDLRVMSMAEYAVIALGTSASFVQNMAYGIGTVMVLGALAAALSVMYAAISARTLEIATLRAIGFGPTPVVVSVFVEALALAGTGAAIGIFVSWLIFHGRAVSGFYGNGGTTPVVVDLGVAAAGAVIAVLVGSLAGLFPAIRAARLPLATALQVR